jgi:hypothetical protein
MSEPQALAEAEAEDAEASSFIGLLTNPFVAVWEAKSAESTSENDTGKTS